MITKRLFDVVVGTLLALLALPFILLCALGIIVTLRVPPFFVQERVGQRGKPFWFVKLRTLPTWVDPYADKYVTGDLALPRFPTMLRRLHLDELPQLFLVPFGQMSLVGPRPEMPTLHTRLPRAFADLRTTVRPGCTGLWQIGADSGRLIAECPIYDQLYFEHQSLRLDIWILARTFALLAGRGHVVTIGEMIGRIDRRTHAAFDQPKQFGEDRSAETRSPERLDAGRHQTRVGVSPVAEAS